MTVAWSIPKICKQILVCRDGKNQQIKWNGLASAISIIDFFDPLFFLFHTRLALQKLMNHHSTKNRQRSYFCSTVTTRIGNKDSFDPSDEFPSSGIVYKPNMIGTCTELLWLYTGYFDIRPNNLPCNIG